MTNKNATYRDWNGVERPVTMFWEEQMAEAQSRDAENFTHHFLDNQHHRDKPRMLIFGGTGGLGQKLSPLLTPFFELKTLGRDVDVRDNQAVENFINDFKPQCVVNMAVLNKDSTVLKLGIEDQHELLDTNVHGALNVLRASLKYFRTQSAGTYIYISSILSARPVIGAGMYSAAKAFNDNLIQTAALENAKYGITVNSLRLGFFDGGLTYKLPQAVQDALLDRIPVKRLGTAQDLAQAINFLHQNRYMTGANLDLSGGVVL